MPRHVFTPGLEVVREQQSSNLQGKKIKPTWNYWKALDGGSKSELILKTANVKM